MHMSTRPNKGLFNRISNLSIYLGNVMMVSSLKWVTQMTLEGWKNAVTNVKIALKCVCLCMCLGTCVHMLVLEYVLVCVCVWVKAPNKPKPLWRVKGSKDGEAIRELHRRRGEIALNLEVYESAICVPSVLLPFH